MALARGVGGGGDPSFKDIGVIAVGLAVAAHVLGVLVVPSGTCVGMKVSNKALASRFACRELENLQVKIVLLKVQFAQVLSYSGRSVSPAPVATGRAKEGAPRV